MKTTIISLFITFCYTMLSAQHKNLVGVYNFPSETADNLGGSTLILTEEQKFVIMAYATIIVGNWEISKSKPEKLVLTPTNPEAKFQVFALKNPEIKEGIQVVFKIDDNVEAYFGTEANALKRIFNRNANCFEPDYIFQDKKRAEKLYLVDLEGNFQNQLYAFSTLGNNQFLVIHKSDSYFFPVMEYGIEKDALIDLSDLQKIRKELTPAGENSELVAMMKRVLDEKKSTHKLFNTDLKGMDHLENPPSLKNYRFNAEKNRYEALHKTDEENEYFKRDVLLKFDKVKSEILPFKKEQMKQGQWFTTECNF